jgi:hypothetical protein
MIREHAFNTRWWGQPVGIVADAAQLFAADVATRKKALAAFAWVEYKAPLAAAVAAADLSRAGFFQCDTQLEFRIHLAQVPVTPSLESLVVRAADAAPFQVPTASVAHFRFERFAHLPGATAEKLDQRYALWANEIIAAHPKWCFEVVSDGKVQGWFLSETRGRSLQLTLAMNHREAKVSGLYVYQRALVEYARRGARMGTAGFSVSNTPVHNIYAHLGAVFTPPIGCWLWVR